jgi:hypothetical protein
MGTGPFTNVLVPFGSEGYAFTKCTGQEQKADGIRSRFCRVLERLLNVEPGRRHRGRGITMLRKEAECDRGRSRI